LGSSKAVNFLSEMTNFAALWGVRCTFLDGVQVAPCPNFYKQAGFPNTVNPAQAPRAVVTESTSGMAGDWCRVLLNSALGQAYM